MTLAKKAYGWLDAVVFDLVRELRWSFLPPLMVYFAAGIQGLTAIVGTFFVKEYLGLSAAFLAGLTFWAGLPWALKMPMGHLVDIIWRWKWMLVWVGAGLIATSMIIMVLLISDPDMMETIAPIPAWYVTSVILAPSGYVVQDAVADAMSVEAVPRFDENGEPLDEERARELHTTMQMLGRVAIITGGVGVSLLNIYMFSGVESLTQPEKAEVYADIYLLALAIPVISVSGVILAALQKRLAARRLRQRGADANEIALLFERPGEPTEPNQWYFIGGGAFVALSLAVGLSGIPFSQEIVFAGSFTIIVFLMRQLVQVLPPEKGSALIGTAVIIFVFRAVPLPGPGATWFSIDELGFDQQFLSVLSLIASVLTLVGMFVLRPLMATRPLTFIVIVLTVAGGIMLLPNIGLYYGLHEITAPMTAGVVDARFIAIIDTAIESPLGQIAMIPMLAWIARNAPANLKATFFAVMASFMNLALSASSLATKYLNQIFTITREVRDRDSGQIMTPADYSELGMLLVTVLTITVAAPLLAIIVVQKSPLKTPD